jgi:hypothetical protein
MRFPMPAYPCDFEIPDDWIAEAEFSGFQPHGPAYLSSANAILLPLNKVEPLVRSNSYPLNFRGLGRDRFVNLLRGFVANDLVPAVPAIVLPVADVCSGTFRYRICNGVHRYYASIAAGYSMIPAEL